MPPMGDTSKHLGELTFGLLAPRTTGDMEARHIIRLKIVWGRMEEDSTGPNISNTLRALGLRIGGGQWEVMPWVRKYRLKPRLVSPRENDCDLMRCRSKLFKRKLLWKYTLLFLNALQGCDPLKSQSSLPSIVLQGCESLMIQICCDSDLSLS